MTTEYEKSEKALKQDYNTVFIQTGEAGKNVLKNLAEICFEGKTTFSPQSPHITSYQEGLRSANEHIKNMISDDKED